MNCERAGELLFERIDGRLDQRASAELGRHLAECDACRTEAEGLGEVWTRMGTLEEERGNADMRDRFYTMLAAYERGGTETASTAPTGAESGPLRWLRGLWPAQPAFQMGVAFAALLVGMWLGPRLGSDGRVGEIDMLRAEMQSMNRAVTLSLLDHQSANQRLRAVGFSQQSASDSEVTDALLATISSDPNVNVRLAALDVLGQMIEQPEVRSGLLDAFPRQQSPTMQVAMTDVLVEMNNPRSRAAIERALDDEELPRSVRDYLQQKLNDRGEQL